MKLEEIDLLDLDRFARNEHHQMFEVLRREAPIFWNPWRADFPRPAIISRSAPDSEEAGFWNVVRYADVVAVNRDPVVFSSEERGSQIYDIPPGSRRAVLMDMDPPKHTRYRRLINKGFTPRMVGMLEQYLRHRSTVIIDSVIERGEADFVDDVATELPLQAIAEIIGVPQEDRRLIFDWVKTVIGSQDAEYGGDMMTAIKSLHSYINVIAADRRCDPRQDICTKLLNAEIDGDRLSEMEFNAFMSLLLVAGAETTRNAITHGIHALLSNHDQFDALKNDLEGLMPATVDEVLRWSSPSLGIRRTAMVNTEIQGQAIKKGAKVVAWYVSANRDDEVFPHASKFDIYRSPNPYVTFGAGGPHFCLGANLAKMEVGVMLAEILTRLPDLTLAGEPQYLRSNVLGGIKHLPVTWTPPVPTSTS